MRVCLALLWSRQQPNNTTEHRARTHRHNPDLACLSSMPWFPHTQHVRRVIGERLIDEVETAHREVVALLEIWREYRERVDEEAGAAEVSVGQKSLRQQQHTTTTTTTTLRRPHRSGHHLLLLCFGVCHGYDLKWPILGSIALHIWSWQEWTQQRYGFLNSPKSVTRRSNRRAAVCSLSRGMRVPISSQRFSSSWTASQREREGYFQ